MLKIVAFVVGAILVWLILTKPATSAVAVAEVIKAVAEFLRVLVLALLQLLGKLADAVSAA
jgi:hypothetical protein